MKTVKPLNCTAQSERKASLPVLSGEEAARHNRWAGRLGLDCLVQAGQANTLATDKNTQTDNGVVADDPY